jgi:hypothetical protein
MLLVLILPVLITTCFQLLLELGDLLLELNNLSPEVRNNEVLRNRILRWRFKPTVDRLESLVCGGAVLDDRQLALL